MVRIAVLLSGEGSNREALSRFGIPVSLVFTDRFAKHAVDRARSEKIAVVRHIRRDFTPTFDRVEYTRRLLQILDVYNIGFVISAGFRTVLDETFCKHFGTHAVNMHPSLLPDFPGPHAVKDALAAKVAHTGCTLHVLSPGVDQGDIIAQARVPVFPNDTVTRLHTRIKNKEHELYPMAIASYIESLGL